MIKQEIEVKRNKKEIDKTKIMGQILKDTSKEFLKIKSEQVEKSMKAIVPVDSGKLKNNISKSPVQELAGELVVEFKTAGVPYAARVHEDPNFRAKRPVPTKEGGVGNKFMTRAGQYHYSDNHDLISITKKLTGIELKEK